jgi:hypothetical protein
MAELLACPKLPDTRRRSGSATIAMPGSRSAVIQRLASAGAAAEMMERPHHLFGISSTRRVSSKREKFVTVQRYFLIRGNPLQGGLQKNHAHPYLTSAKRGARSGSEGQGAARGCPLRRCRNFLGKCLCHMSRHNIDIYTHIHRQVSRHDMTFVFSMNQK